MNHVEMIIKNIRVGKVPEKWMEMGKGKGF